MSTALASCLTAGIDYVLRGWYVIPLHSVTPNGDCTCGNAHCASPGKHPRTDHGLKDASIDPAAIVTWWGQWPDANIGIVTGQSSKLIVLDVDPNAGGDDTLLALEGQRGALPTTIESITGGSGRHVLFAATTVPLRNSAGKLGAGLDIRAEGGYIVAPPSLHTSGNRYEWDGAHHPDDVPLADLPGWLVGMLAVAPTNGKATSNGQATLITKGERNGTLASIAGAMRRQGADAAAILAALEHVNTAQCQPPLPDDEVRKIAASIGNYTPIFPTGIPTGATPHHRPNIDIHEHDLPIIRKEAWQAIKLTNDSEPEIFRFGNAVMRLQLSADDTPLLQEVTIDRLRYTLGNVAIWYSANQQGIKRKELPPLHVVRDLLADPFPPLPALTRIVDAPVFGPSGILQTTPGYHEDSRTYYRPAPGVVIPAIAEHPTDAEVASAKSLILDELMGDFPFVGEPERANAVALLLLPFVRDLIDAPTPIHLIEAPTPGSGKGLLADVLLRVAIGKSIGVITAPDDEDEWRKSLTAQFREATAAILIDNLTRVLDSGVLASALTATTWGGRILGVNENLHAPVRCAWVVTANNPTMSTEIARRCVRIRLDPHVDRPWQRGAEQFRHHPLGTWADSHRGELIWATATLVRAWIAGGRPGGTAMLGSYEQWSRVIGGILAINHIGGFLGNLMQFYEANDQEGQVWRSFVVLWWEKWGSAEVTTTDLFPLALEVDGMPIGRSGSERAQKTAFGIALGKQRDRVIGQYQVLTGGKRHSALLWKVSPVIATPTLEGFSQKGEPGNLGEPLLPPPIIKKEIMGGVLQGSPGSPGSPFPPKISDYVNLIAADGAIQTETPWRIIRIENGPDGNPYAFFAEAPGGWPLAQCERADTETEG